MDSDQATNIVEKRGGKSDKFEEDLEGIIITLHRYSR